MQLNQYLLIYPRLASSRRWIYVRVLFTISWGVESGIYICHKTAEILKLSCACILCWGGSMNKDIHEGVATLENLCIVHAFVPSPGNVIFTCNSRQQLGVLSAQQRISWFNMQFISWPAFGREEICTGVTFNFPWKKLFGMCTTCARKQCHIEEKYKIPKKYHSCHIKIPCSCPI